VTGTQVKFKFKFTAASLSLSARATRGRRHGPKWLFNLPQVPWAGRPGPARSWPLGPGDIFAAGISDPCR
jgi:hypothetical protein